ncbi:uncharacterized protein LOC141876417 isoform X1 [Acropora palmata]|uniref:uncharacterized protein LOC141876417 isoform X1 n=1 Tax=Acropora palmata TaxID=6131 RepID=UPI003DA0F003
MDRVFKVSFMVTALLSLGNGRAVAPNTVPWNTIKETSTQEKKKIDDGALQNEHSSMSLEAKEEGAPRLQTISLDEESESPNEVHDPIANVAEEKRQEILSRLKRNACVTALTKYVEGAVIYTVFHCASNCYPIYAKTNQGTAIVVGCVKSPTSG